MAAQCLSLTHKHSASGNPPEALFACAPAAALLHPPATCLSCVRLLCAPSPAPVMLRHRATMPYGSCTERPAALQGSRAAPHRSMSIFSRCAGLTPLCFPCRVALLTVIFWSWPKYTAVRPRPCAQRRTPLRRRCTAY